MADQTRPAGLPSGSIVVDDLKGEVWYVVDGPGVDWRWEINGDSTPTRQ